MPPPPPIRPEYNPDSLDAVVSRIEAKLDSWVNEARTWRQVHDRQLAEVKATVESHERFKYWVLGLAAATGALGSKLLSFFTGAGNPKP